MDSLDNNYKFTGHERDAESGLDHTLHRKYASNLGRWHSPDPVRGEPSNPQSWNRYAYTAGNPVNRVDPSGSDCFDPFSGIPCLSDPFGDDLFGGEGQVCPVGTGLLLGRISGLTCVQRSA